MKNIQTFLRPLYLLFALASSPAFAWSPDDFVMPTDAELRARITPEQFRIVRQGATERSHTSPLLKEKRAGIYVDIVSGEPLFSSLDKYDSGTGWPSFKRPIHAKAMVTAVDRKLSTPRTEVKSRFARSHLGHVFDDGPAPTGLRYCINGKALRFIPVEALREQGYAEFLRLFPAYLANNNLGIATFSGGCFWTTESDFEKAPGVLDVVAGFSGGTTYYPTYDEVSRDHSTDQIEAGFVIYDTRRTDYATLTDYFWHHIDPTTGTGQFGDRGPHYRPVLYYGSPTEEQEARRSKKALEDSRRFAYTIRVEISEASPFYPAGKKHQEFYLNYSATYRRYREATGRDEYLRNIWK